MKTVLSIIGTDTGDSHLENSLSLCRSAGAELTVIVLDAAVSAVVSQYGAADAALRSDAYQHGESQVEARVAMASEALQSSGVQGRVVSAYVQGTELQRVVTQHAMFADLVLLPVGLPVSSSMYRQAFDAVSFGAGCPVLLIPQGGTTFPASSHAMVAWDGGVQSARAVREAVGSLAQADRVTAVTVDGGPRHGAMDAGLIGYLRAHDVTLAVQDVNRSGQSIGQTITDTAVSMGADLVVMGAYGHSRLREWMLGGTTRHLMEHSPVSLLLVH